MYFLLFLHLLSPPAAVDSLNQKEKIAQNSESVMPDFIMSEEEEEAAYAVPSLLQAAQDVFSAAAAMSLRNSRFRFRGQDFSEEGLYINGILNHRLENGRSNFQDFAGLNEILYFRETKSGLEKNDFAFGKNALNINNQIGANKFRKGAQAKYTYANGIYRHRLQLACHSGLQKNNWAYSAMFVGRWSDEGYVPGTFQKTAALYLSAFKQINYRHNLTFNLWGGLSKFGAYGASTQHAQNISGDPFYNPVWGYDNGKKRNARILTQIQPYLTVTHEYKSKNIHTVSNILTTIGRFSITRFDWFNGTNPAPDYYQKLPSFYQAPGNEALYERLVQKVKQNPNLLQIDWNALRQANQNSVETIIYNQDTITGKRAHYIVAQPQTDNIRLAANHNLTWQVSPYFKINIGLQGTFQRNHYYQLVNDLLGADFWVNVNSFFLSQNIESPENAQYDLNNPNKIIRQNEKYGRDYLLYMHDLQLWQQASFQSGKIDGFIGLSINNSGFMRTGNIRSGLYPNSSFGSSPYYTFSGQSFKGGLTYKISGLHYIDLLLGFTGRAPHAEEVFMMPEMNESVQDNIKNKNTATLVLSYIARTQYIKFKTSAYLIKSRNGMEVLRFYNDEYRNFVSYGLTNVGKDFYGIELGADIRIHQNIHFKTASNFGYYIYARNVASTTKIDNEPNFVSREPSYLKSYRLPYAPQQAHNLTLQYRHPKFWTVAVSEIISSDFFVGINPFRRTSSATRDINRVKDAAFFSNVLNNQKLPLQFWTNLYAAYSKRIRNVFGQPLYLRFALTINNLLNHKNYVTSAAEQLRFNDQDTEFRLFPERFRYANGLTFGISVSVSY